MSADKITMNSCQYTPVYFIQNPGVSQARSYVLTQNKQEIEKPVSENLKRFYENSGNLETNLTTTEIPKQKVVKKTESVVGNNLKLASFLIPKTEFKTEQSKPIITPVNNLVLKPVYIASNVPNNSNAVPKLDVSSKIVMLKDFPNVIRSQNGKILPKIKPKDNASNKSKHTSVQLLKLGETYHSLNQLSDDQMKIVNHALKIFSDPQSSPPVPTYDPVTNTKFIYKVVSPKDLAVVGNNKLNKLHKVDIQPPIVKQEPQDQDSDFEEQKLLETKITRSGRIVKVPRNIIHEPPDKPKRKTVPLVECPKCPAKFTSPHRLQRHYEQHNAPDHSDLFQCFCNIIKIGSANTFVQQIEQFVNKLKSCISCLLADTGSGTPAVVNEDVARLLGISPGKYNLNMDALNCEKDKNGYCIHNRQLPSIIETPKPKITEKKTNSCLPDLAEYLVLKNNKSIKEKPTQPNIIRKIDCRKQKHEINHNNNTKRMKLTAEVDKNNVIDDIITLLNDTNKTDSLEKPVDNIEVSEKKETEIEKLPAIDAKPTHIQFRSTHFDIRSSPIKSSSTVFRKFQINPAKMAKYEVEIIQPINKVAQEMETTSNTGKGQDIIQKSPDITEKEPNPIEKEPYIMQEEPSIVEKVPYIMEGEPNVMDKGLNIPRTDESLITFNGASILKNTNIQDSSNTEAWTEQLEYDKSILSQPDDFLKSDISIQPSLLHSNGENVNNEVHNDLNQGQSIISFLESLGNELCSESDRNNPVDFHLDLFSFNS